MTWKSQIAEGRVFQLRSKSKRYPPPCGLVVDASAKYGRQFLRRIDDKGVTGHNYYSRPGNPNISVESIRPDQFTSARIAQRRPDLERFSADDLALIRYGYDLDFDGRIRGSSMPSIPLTRQAEWTVFWTPPYTEGFPWIHLTTREHSVIAGAWHFEDHGGPANLGFKYGHLHATCHTGARLDRVRKIILRHLPDLIETKVRVVHWEDNRGQTHTTSEYDTPCPALGEGRTTIIQNSKGESMICCGPREKAVTL